MSPQRSPLQRFPECLPWRYNINNTRDVGTSAKNYITDISWTWTCCFRAFSLLHIFPHIRHPNCPSSVRSTFSNCDFWANASIGGSWLSVQKRCWSYFIYTKNKDLKSRVKQHTDILLILGIIIGHIMFCVTILKIYLPLLSVVW